MNDSPPEISLHLRPVVNPNMVLRVEDDDYALLYDPETGAVRILNEPAVAVWRLIDGRRTLAEVMAALGEEFEDMSPQAEGQVLRLVGDLFRAGALGAWEDRG